MTAVAQAVGTVPEIAIAFDVPNLERALALDETLGPGPELAKVGLELFTAAGPDVVRALRERGRRVFLDLKLHDIPNTVRGAAASAGRLGVDLLTVHAMGGHGMVAAAVAGAAESGARTRVVAVTVLTSLDAFSLPPGFQRPFHSMIVIAQLADLVEAAGAHGIVCAASDLPPMMAFRRRPVFAVTPGIRPAGSATHDQARVTTVDEAVAMGSSLLVLGRAVTAASDPRAALAAARAERDKAFHAKSSPTG
ncbi:MAG: orotidine-5'-phosphate decarboxylase [Candidatus Eisenbacteria bacterium]|uniref:Orotidine 5'-phosphate decarboxylase n=1 Tax=Eiseniibacteriota bacterium TaxID=2212470 RepID=A0A538U9E5_UNCEI|nr:MAG: orotidine-5'-phosphate decarboxylase [Candidatus Eisenbacteria bacterium]